nr:MAG TPA: minor tail protein [Caudoviricetes sp.]
MNLLDLFVKITVDADNAMDEIKNVGEKASGLGDKFTNAAKKIAEFGVKATAVASAAATAVGKYAIDVGSAFDASMSKVAAISGATGDELDALRDKAKEMGAQTKFSASESADAFTYMAMAGWKTEDMLDGIEGIMNLAAASGEDLATTSDIVTDALTAFGLTAADSAHFADVLAAASNNANTNVSMLGESFKYVAPVAGAMGYSAEDVSVALGLMANSGIKASQAGTSLRSALSRLVNPTDDMWEAITGLGLAMTDYDEEFHGVLNNLGEYNGLIYNSDGSTKSFAETMEILRSSMAGLSESQRSYFVNELFGQEAMSGMLAIINATDEDFNKLTESINNADGTAQKMADTMNDNLEGALTILKSATEGFGIALYETFSGKAQSAVETLTGYISRLQEAFSAGGMKGLLDEFSSVLSDAIGYIVEQLPHLIEIGASVIASLASGIVDNLPALADAAIAIVLQIADSIVEGIPELISTLVQITTEIVNKLSDPAFLTQLIETALQMIVALADGLISAVPELIRQVPIIIANLVAAFVAEIPNILTTGIDLLFALIDGIVQTIPELVAAVPDVIIGFTNGIANNLDKILLAAPQIILSLIKGILGAIPELIAAVPRVIAAIADTIRNYSWADIGKNIVTGLKNGIAAMWEDLKRWFSDKVNALVGSVKRVLGIHSPSRVFAGIGENMALGLGEGWDNEYDSIKRGITGGLDFGTAQIGAEQSFGGQMRNALSSIGNVGGDITIVVQSVLDGKIIGESVSKYNRQMQRAMGV